MKLRIVIFTIAGMVFLNLSGCEIQSSKDRPDELSNSIHQSITTLAEEKQIPDRQSSNVTEIVPPSSQDTEFSQKYLVSYWDEFAQSYGGPKAYFGVMPMDVDLLPLYIAGMKHDDPYVRWVCAYKAFDYHVDARKLEIIKALQPLLTDPVLQVRDAAKFSMEVMNETLSGPEFVHSPNGKYVAFNPFINTRFNDGKLWVYSSESHHYIMALQLLSIGGDNGVAGYIHWSPDGSKLAVGDGGRLWSNTVILNLSNMTENKQNLFSYLSENSKKFGYNIGDYQRSDPAVRFLEWSPDSKKVLLSYCFYEDMEKCQSGIAVYNTETDKYERIIPNKCSKDYPQVEKPDDFHW